MIHNIDPVMKNICKDYIEEGNSLEFVHSILERHLQIFNREVVEIAEERIVTAIKKTASHGVVATEDLCRELRIDMRRLED